MMGQGSGTGLRGARRLALACATAAMSISASTAALAGTFEMTWGTPPFDWPAGLLGTTPNYATQVYTMTDERGFELSVAIQARATGGSQVPDADGTPIYPDDVTFFGNDPTLGLVYDAGPGNSGIGESTMEARMILFSDGQLFPTNGVTFEVSDIDSVDNNGNTDRCDFVTVTGNAGNPVLTPVGTGAGVSVRIGGPGVNGSGATGPLAANQAQCIYNLGAAGSPNSAGDDDGTILATFPDGTSVATIAYDESIENVLGVTNRNAAARGIGAFAAVAVTNDDDGTITLVKTADREFFDTVGETITYTYQVTNNGRLPINTNQDIDIQDDVLGLVQCPAITADVPPNGTFTCTATYTVTNADLGNPSIDNTAVAGVGLPNQAFADRLQSNADDATVARAAPAGTVQKFRQGAPGNPAVTGPDQTVNYRIRVRNTGNVPLTAPSLVDTLPDGTTATVVLTNGNPTNANNTGDVDGDGEIDVGEVWLYRASYETTQADIDAGTDLVNTATFTAAELPNPIVDTQTTPVARDPRIALSKRVDDDSGVVAGQELSYLYEVTNTGNVTLLDVSVADLHDGLGTAPVPGLEQILFDNAPTGDSSDVSVDGTWDRLGPNDVVRFRATYTVVQADIDQRQ